MIQWTRKKMLHLFNVYAYDVSYTDRQESNTQIYGDLQETITQLGRAPWALGADFNQPPTEPLIGWYVKAHMAAPAAPTHVFGRVLDWFLLSIGLGDTRQVDLVHDTSIAGHTLVLLTLPSYLDLDLGRSIKRPRRLIPQQEQTGRPGPTPAALRALLSTQDPLLFWNRWNYLAEGWLMEATQAGPKPCGRGVGIQTVPNTASAPQDPNQGFAITETLRNLMVTLAKWRRADMYRKLPRCNQQQHKEWIEQKIQWLKFSFLQVFNCYPKQCA